MPRQPREPEPKPTGSRRVRDRPVEPAPRPQVSTRDPLDKPKLRLRVS
jgi:hypothetical protein